MKRPRLRFRLATLLLVVALSAVAIEVIAYRVRRDARVKAEIENMKQAMIKFQNKYKDYPPSRVVMRVAATSPPR
jgi:hypothetical protein